MSANWFFKLLFVLLFAGAGITLVLVGKGKLQKDTTADLGQHRQDLAGAEYYLQQGQHQQAVAEVKDTVTSAWNSADQQTKLAWGLMAGGGVCLLCSVLLLFGRLRLPWFVRRPNLRGYLPIHK